MSKFVYIMGVITVTTNVPGASIMVVSGSKIKAEGTADEQLLLILILKVLLKLSRITGLLNSLTVFTNMCASTSFCASKRLAYSSYYVLSSAAATAFLSLYSNWHPSFVTPDILNKLSTKIIEL